MKGKLHIFCNIVSGVSLIVFILIMLFVFKACVNRSSNNQQKINIKKSKPEFKKINVPDYINKPSDIAVYLATHYWDNFDFTDTSYIHFPQVTEQAFADYIEILPHTESQVANSSIKTLLKHTLKEQSGVMYFYFCGLFKKYLYEPNSILRNDELYIPVVECIISDRITGIAEKERAKFQLEMMMKNRIGKTASDFSYTLSSGKTETLYQLESNYILLLFYNPDCHACEAIITAMKTSDILRKYIENRTITVLSFYPDADINIWKNHLNDIPANWVNGYDKKLAIQNEHLYDLKAIPSLYLLDRNKNVILKDTDLIIIEEYFENKKFESILK